MIRVDLTKVLHETTLLVLYDVAKYSGDTVDNRYRRLGLSRQALIYRLNKLCTMGLLNSNNSRYTLNIQCPYCYDDTVCTPNVEPRDGCRLTKELTVQDKPEG